MQQGFVISLQKIASYRNYPENFDCLYDLEFLFAVFV